MRLIQHAAIFNSRCIIYNTSPKEKPHKTTRPGAAI